MSKQISNPVKIYKMADIEFLKKKQCHKNTKITPQNSGEINLRIIGSLHHGLCRALTLK